jgi:hypothetical protein
MKVITESFQGAYLLLVQSYFQHPIFFKIAIDAVYVDQFLDEFDAIQGHLPVIPVAVWVGFTPIHQAGGNAESTIPSTGSIPAARPFKQQDFLVRESLLNVIGGGQAGIASPNDDHIRPVTSP